MTEEHDIAQKAITQDLFGPEALTEPAEISAPEKYELGRCLGRGGFGVVYLATDRVLNRQVALKFLTNARPADVERLRREARYTARLNSPSIVQVYDFGEVDGQPYIVMQYIDGGSLGTVTLELPELLRAIISVAQALDHAHAEGIVHRDIKPANILIDQQQRSYLTDFGIARDLGKSCGSLSLDGAIIGTPELMSPEQARGELRRIDARSDIYSLGATLYTQLTGRMPFHGPSTVDILHAVIHDEPTLPRLVKPSIPRALEAILLRCLRKEKRHRYPTMRELSQDLMKVLEGTPITSEGAIWFRKLVGAPLSPAPETDETEANWSVAVEVAREIAAWDAHLYRVSSNIPKTYPQLDAIIARLDEILEQNPDTAWARFYRGSARYRRGDEVGALEDMEPSISRMSDRAGAHFELGRLYFELYLKEQKAALKHISKVGIQDHLKGAQGRLDQAVIAFQEAQERHDGLPLWQVDYARAVERLAEGDPEGCVALCDELLAKDPDVEQLWKLRGDALRFSSQDPIESYERAVAVRRSYYEVLFAKAEVLFERGEYEEALSTLTAALEIDPEFLDAMALFGRIKIQQGRARNCTTALGLGLEQVLRGLEIDPQHYELNLSHAEILIEQGRIGSDEDLFARGLAVLDRATGLQGCQNRILLLTAQGHLQRARHRMKTGGDPRPDLEAVLAHEKRDGFEEFAHEPWRETIREAKEEWAALEKE